MAIDQKKIFSGIYKGKKVLLTGDAGFKGSWLAIWLHQLGAEVYGYGTSSKTPDGNFHKAKVADIIHHTEGNINDYDALKNYIQYIKPDFAFHLAAQALVLESFSNPRETLETNIIGTANFFEAVRNTPGIKAAINVTSDKSYRNTGKAEGYKEEDFLGGIDPYSASKSCSEIITHSYEKSFFKDPKGTLVASGRAGNVIGGGDWAKNRIVPDLIRAHLKKEKLPLRNPNSVRPWQFVLEPLSGYLDLCSRLFLNGNKFCGGWNFGPDESNSHSVMDVVKEAEKFFGKIDIEVIPSPFIEAGLLSLDISKARRELKWEPTLNFKDTIDFTVKGYLDELSDKNIYKCRVDQLEEYVAHAQQKNINWAVSN